jgi:hypothetical protein
MMATLVLTAVGTMVGGPIGGALGALAGQAVDGRLFAPSARQGPRLATLAVQTSTYGGDIAKVFGRIRVAGTVIWASGLREEKSTSGGSKGRPKSVEYAYSASFAVLLSGRRVRDVGRIWADGKLLRGVAGDFKTPTGFRLWQGGEDQAEDPLIAAAEGAGGTPAYRGSAYAVFEDLQLADFGNRIPSLTFEVIADEGAVAVADIAAELSDGAVSGGGAAGLLGLAASGDTVRTALEPLTDAFGLTLVTSADGLRLVDPFEEPVREVTDADAASAQGRGPWAERVRRGASATAREVSLAYFDPERDYQAGLQRATRFGGRGEERLALPASLETAEAKRLAAARLARLAAGGETLRLRLAPRWLALAPGSRIRWPRDPRPWLATKVELERLAVLIELVRLPLRPAEQGSASPGRALSEPDAEAGATRLLAFELPSDGETMSGPRLLVAASGEGAGWRPVPLSVAIGAESDWRPAGRSAPPAVLGESIGPLPPRGSALLDTASILEVELLRDDQWLESRSDAALAAGVNAALVAGEILQFGTAEPSGPRRFRLSRLLRGRRGTEPGGVAPAGSPFLLLDEAAVVTVDLPPASVGGSVRVASDAAADDTTAPVAHIVAGEALRPPSPVHLSARRTSDGGVHAGWVRRSRAGWLWGDADVPLGEEREAYRITVASASAERSWEVPEPSAVIAGAELAAAGIAGALQLSIVQLGTFAASRAARITLA